MMTTTTSSSSHCDNKMATTQRRRLPRQPPPPPVQHGTIWWQWWFMLVILYHSNLIITAITAQQYSTHVTDLCDSGTVDSAAHLHFLDGIQRTFVSAEHHYWLLNITDELPAVDNARKIPFGFKPDVAILKDTRNCSEGRLSLLLIQMSQIKGSSEAEWLTLEMKIGRWSDNETGPVMWGGQVEKIAHCDLEAAICTTTDNYFATMSFDFKKKLDSAFGTIGRTAYFVQGQLVYKVQYKTECITNPYKEVITYPPMNLGTETTAALAMEDTIRGNITVTLFDKDVHNSILTATHLNTVDIVEKEKFTDICNWFENGNIYFRKCPPINESTINFLLLDIFSNSKRHAAKKRLLLLTSAIVLASLALLVFIIIVFNLLKNKLALCGEKKKKSISITRTNSDSSSSLATNNDEQLIERTNNVQINKAGGSGGSGSGGEQNGDQQKTLLQTSC